MAHIHQKKELTRENTISPIIAGIAGVVAGGVAIATALALSDRKNQKKVKEVFVDTKERVAEYIGTIQTKPILKTGVQTLKNAVNDTKEKIVNV
jgi:hypothetical protein